MILESSQIKLVPNQTVEYSLPFYMIFLMRLLQTDIHWYCSGWVWPPDVESLRLVSRKIWQSGLYLCFTIVIDEKLRIYSYFLPPAWELLCILILGYRVPGTIRRLFSKSLILRTSLQSHSLSSNNQFCLSQVSLCWRWPYMQKLCSGKISLHILRFCHKKVAH